MSFQSSILHDHSVVYKFLERFLFQCLIYIYIYCVLLSTFIHGVQYNYR